MKVIKLLSTVMLAMFTCMNFAACSKDDDEVKTTVDIVGLWECVSSEIQGPNLGEDHGFESGAQIKFLNKGKCFISFRDGKFEIYIPGSGWELVSNPSENQWGDEDGEGDTWSLKGNALSIIESDLDRWIGTIEMKGKDLIFTYKYQNWNYNSGTMTEEGKEVYISKFVKK